MIDLNFLWFVLIGILFAGYAVLDGFDLGVGALHLFSRGDLERRVMLNSIGPVWDGNEVWLVTGGGALFAAFPEAYATVFSGFYLGLMLLLLALIFRAVAIEFRGKQPMAWWRRLWDTCFSAGSILAAFLLGLVVGNLARGVPLDEKFEFTGSLLGLFNPYSLLVGITTVALFAMHGALYISLKAEGDLEARSRGWAKKAWVVFALCYVATTAATLLSMPQMTANIRNHPVLSPIPILALLAIANIAREIYTGRQWRAFLSSCTTTAALVALFAIGIYPNLVYSPENSLSIARAASSPKTLKIMLLIVAIGFPLVLVYTSYIYWVFRGKVRLDSSSY